MTGVKNVYAGGGCVQGGKMAVRSVAHGRIIAENIIRHALGTITGAGQWEFNFSSGKPGRDECENLAGDSAGIARSQKEKTNPEGLTEQEAAQEAQRCLHCDCAKRDTCTLRTYAQRYGVSPNAYASEKLKPIRRTTQHPRIVYEQNKCIRCGLCVRITEKANERFGLAFFGRGFGVEIVPALGVSMGEAVTSTVDECVLSCPTGALSYKR
jgi:predicted molibdopterin-dependent oxidoreductase YjgC